MIDEILTADIGKGSVRIKNGHVDYALKQLNDKERRKYDINIKPFSSSREPKIHERFLMLQASVSKKRLADIMQMSLCAIPL